MWFNSFAFWVFLLVVLVAYRFLDHKRRNWLLLGASYFFYGCWDWRFLGLILFTTLFDFLAARAIYQSDNARIRKAWLIASVTVELSILGLFKYLGFFVTEFSQFLTTIGLGDWRPGLEIILPVGISFYTFQALSYTIDVYRGRTKPATHFTDFALYISFFPQLVAGPIERSHHLLPQVQNPRPRCDGQRFKEGLYHVLTGLFKKVVIADNMAWLANDVFSRSPESLNPLDILLGVYAFAFQIYGDFSGYSSIAIGVSKWLGFDLMENFRQPYFATDPRKFWQRWHISLSTWLRDYLYIPLGGNRRGATRTYRNLLLTMVLGGLWHGAAWTFMIWGFLHGIWLAAHRFLDQRRQNSSPHRQTSLAVKLLAWAGTFHLVCLTWLFFRANDLSQALQMLQILCGSSWEITPFAKTTATLIAFFVGPLVAFELWIEKKGDPVALTRRHWIARGLVYLYIVFMMLAFPPPVATEFIYFQF